MLKKPTTPGDAGNPGAVEAARDCRIGVSQFETSFGPPPGIPAELATGEAGNFAGANLERTGSGFPKKSPILWEAEPAPDEVAALAASREERDDLVASVLAGTATVEDPEKLIAAAVAELNEPPGGALPEETLKRFESELRRLLLELEAGPLAVTALVPLFVEKARKLGRRFFFPDERPKPKPENPFPDVTEQILDLIFTDGRGETASRLVMDFDGNAGGTGWSRRALNDRIAAVLDEQYQRALEVGLSGLDDPRIVPEDCPGCDLVGCKKCDPLPWGEPEPEPDHEITEPEFRLAGELAAAIVDTLSDPVIDDGDELGAATQANLIRQAKNTIANFWLDLGRE